MEIEQQIDTIIEHLRNARVCNKNHDENHLAESVICARDLLNSIIEKIEVV